jgi:hypothetical protein
MLSVMIDARSLCDDINMHAECDDINHIHAHAHCDINKHVQCNDINARADYDDIYTHA